MQTFQEQKAYFEAQWPAIREALESGGAKAAIEHILTVEDGLERRILFVFARMGVVMGEWKGKSFDAGIEVADAGIAELLRQAEAAEDEETRKMRVNGAHIISYNLAADLADCWPDDVAPRTRAHFERGKKAAEDCIGWCAPEILDGLANDWWVKGMHELSLGDATDAVASWEKSLSYAKESARAQDMPDTVGTTTGFGVILGSGYVGLAKAVAAQPGGFEQFEQAVGAFTSQLPDENLRDDATFGISQLQWVQGRYLRSTPEKVLENLASEESDGDGESGEA